MRLGAAFLALILMSNVAYASDTQEWVLEKSASLKSGGVNLTLIKTSQNGVACAWGRGEKIQIQFRCIDGKTSVIFLTGCNMIAAEYPGYDQVSSQVDGGDPVNFQATEALHNKALGFFDEGQTIKYAKGLYGKSILSVGMRPFQEDAFTATFDIRNLQHAIKPLSDACDW